MEDQVSKWCNLRRSAAGTRSESAHTMLDNVSSTLDKTTGELLPIKRLRCNNADGQAILLWLGILFTGRHGRSR